ncbi:hypothetical protein [Parashewanella curva]|uniref:hypothetical protein n=1 Tax=Parashewanella curva TaxID=2338552 RepID=UPI001059434D|nr:hypothetical protein [Parashewanella curva]
MAIRADVIVEQGFLLWSYDDSHVHVQLPTDSLDSSIDAIGDAVWNTTNTPLEQYVFYSGGCNYQMRINLNEPYGIELFMLAKFEVNASLFSLRKDLKDHYTVALDTLEITEIKKLCDNTQVSYADRTLRIRPGFENDRIQTNVEALLNAGAVNGKLKPDSIGAKIRAFNIKLHELEKVESSITLRSWFNNTLKCPVIGVHLTHSNAVMLRQNSNSLLLSKNGFRRLLLENFNIRTDYFTEPSDLSKVFKMTELTPENIEPVTRSNYYASTFSVVKVFTAQKVPQEKVKSELDDKSVIFSMVDSLKNELTDSFSEKAASLRAVPVNPAPSMFARRTIGLSKLLPSKLVPRGAPN